MAWLLKDGEVLATLDVASSIVARSRGLLGLDSFDGAILLSSTRAIHTLGMRFPIDVAFCDRKLTVISVTRVPPYRICLPRLRARCVIEAEAGAFERWRLRSGDRLEVRA